MMPSRVPGSCLHIHVSGSAIPVKILLNKNGTTNGRTLTNLIQNYSGAVVIVSHDRYILDLVADEIADLEDGRLTIFPGNYSEYAFEKQARLLRQQQRFQAQQKEIDRLEQSAKRLLMWGETYDNEKFIKRGKNILKRIERMDKIDRPTLERRRMGLELSGWRGSDKVLEIRGLDKVFPSHDGEEESLIFMGLETTLWRGERAGLVGTDWTPRELRHSFVSLLSAHDMPLENISRLVGHTNTIVTETVYRKQIRPVMQEGARAMDTIFPTEPEA